MFSAVKPPAGVPFADYLTDRAATIAGTERTARPLAIRAWAHIREHERLTESLEREPTAREHAERWGTTEPTVERTRRDMRALFPGMTVSEVVAELWNGVSLAQDAAPRSFRPIQLDMVHVAGA